MMPFPSQPMVPQGLGATSPAQAGGPLPNPVTPEGSGNPFVMPGVDDAMVAAIIQAARRSPAGPDQSNHPGQNIGGELSVPSPAAAATAPTVNISATRPNLVRDSSGAPVNSGLMAQAVRAAGAQRFGRA